MTALGLRQLPSPLALLALAFPSALFGAVQVGVRLVEGVPADAMSFYGVDGCRGRAPHHIFTGRDWSGMPRVDTSVWPAITRKMIKLVSRRDGSDQLKIDPAMGLHRVPPDTECPIPLVGGSGPGPAPTEIRTVLGNGAFLVHPSKESFYGGSVYNSSADREWVALLAPSLIVHTAPPSCPCLPGAVFNGALAHGGHVIRSNNSVQQRAT